MPREPLPIGGLGHISTRRLAPGKWVATSRIRDTDGVVRQIKATGATSGKAETKLKANAARRVPATGHTLTGNTLLSDAANAWIQTLTGAPTTITAYQRAARHITLGGYRLAELRTSTIQAMLDTITAASGPATARQVRNVTRQILDMCVRDDAITTNPAAATTVAKRTRQDFTALTGADIVAIREHVTAWGQVKTPGPPRNAPLLLDFLDVLAGTGARPGEVLALRWEDVDFTAGTVTISGTLVRTNGSLWRKPEPKTARSNRTLQLPALTVQVLRVRYMRAEDKGPGAPVFASRVGGWIEASNLQSRWAQARGERWAHVTFRDYRKAVATLLKHEVGIEAAAAQLGHSSPEVTRRHYVERDGVVDFSEAIAWEVSS